MSAPHPYEGSFYAYVDDLAAGSAEPVVDLLTTWFDPRSAVDVGCGTGAWLAAFGERGATDVLGLDHEAVPEESIRIPLDRFVRVDLTDPPDLGRSFDLALCLEVAEHLPETSAEAFVRYLTSLAPVIVFSAAIPGQGGVGHVNEQWPAYWADRFAAAGFACLDALRPRLWDDDRIAPYYRQNLLLFVAREELHRVPSGARPPAFPDPPLALVHPGTFELVRTTLADRPAAPPSLSSLLRSFPGATSRAVRRRLGRPGSGSA